MKFKKTAKKSIFRSFLIILALMFNQLSLAESTSAHTFKRDIAYSLYGSMGGAILGLSSLSFYGNPQEHSGNVTTGAILGFLGGLGFALYQHSTRSVFEESGTVLIIPLISGDRASGIVLQRSF